MPDVSTSATNTAGIIGSSPVMREVIARVQQIAPTDLCVLITGESGTGKEVFAQALHRLSLRRKERMVSLNCGAIPETLLESELFGSEKGAYTGAAEQRKGFFEAANRGTIFLDELGEMPLGTQVKLLRVLETGEFSRLGSTDVIRSDVRVIAATNRRLEEEVGRGTFRQDLFYRLNTVQIEIPPLREHPEDIPELVEYFARRTAAKIGAPYEGISTDALRLLVNLPWAGNVRELRNLIETVVTLEKGHHITVESLRPYMPRALKPPSAVLTEVSSEFSAAKQTQTLHSATTPKMLPPYTDSDAASGLKNESLAMMPFMAELLYDTTKPLMSSFPAHLLHRSSKTSEQIERELMYKALVDLVREVAHLRGEVADLKADVHSALFADKPEAETAQKSASVGVISVQRPGTSAEEELPTEEIPLAMHEVEKRLIGAALSRFEGNRRQAADALGISERTLYRKLREYGLETE
jgi:transcriptional regulator with PAS, ATPase and Fis domain